MRVGGFVLTQRDVERELDAFASDKGVREALSAPSASGQAPLIAAESAGTVVSNGLPTFLVNHEIQNAATATLLARAGISEVAPLSEDQAGAMLFGTGPVAAAWRSLPSAVRARWTTATAQQSALEAKASGPQADERVQRAIYDSVGALVGQLTFDDFRSRTTTELDGNTWGQLLSVALSSTATSMGVRIDPRYGSWDATRGFTRVTVPLAGAATSTSTPTGA